MTDFNLKKLLIDVFDPVKEDRVVILVDMPHGNIRDNDNWEKRRLMAKEWWNEFEKLSNERRFFVHPLVTFAATGSNNSDLSDSFLVGQNKYDRASLFSDCTLFVALTEFSASAPLIHLMKKYPILRGASMPKCVKEMEESGLAADYRRVATLCDKLKERMDRSVGGNVTFSTGHACYFDLRFHNAIVDNGLCHIDKTGIRLVNLPSGETCQVPYEGNKVGIESMTKGELPHLIDGKLVVYRVEKNRIIDVIGDQEKAVTAKKYFESDIMRSNIAEFGLGCNEKAIVRGIILEDEKAGFHWAYGRSDHIGGNVSAEDFKSPKNVVHFDIAYAPTSPIKAKTIELIYDNGSTEHIWKDNWYYLG